MDTEDSRRKIKSHEETQKPATLSNDNDSDDQYVDDFMRRLVTEGKRVEATSPLIDINQKPDYFNLERFKRAQQTCSKYYTNLSLASSTGLMMLLQIESILIPLLKSGKSQTVVHLYDRYTMTAKYVRQYYETDFYESSTEGGKAIRIVRSMHQRIHKHMNDHNQNIDHNITDNNDNDNDNNYMNGQLWVNQHDMALTQFAFIGLFLLYPRKCVAYHITKDELSDLAYYWRLISYHLGIEERFNIFSQCDDIDRQTKLMQSLLEHFNSLRTETQIDVGKRMAEGVMLAFEDFLTESSFNILDHYWSPCFSLSGDHQLKPYTIGDRWKLIFFHFYFDILFRSAIVMRFMNNMYKRKFDKFIADEYKIKPKLAKKYEHIIYRMHDK